MTPDPQTAAPLTDAQITAMLNVARAGIYPHLCYVVALLEGEQLRRAQAVPPQQEASEAEKRQQAVNAAFKAGQAAVRVQELGRVAALVEQWRSEAATAPRLSASMGPARARTMQLALEACADELHAAVSPEARREAQPASLPHTCMGGDPGSGLNGPCYACEDEKRASAGPDVDLTYELYRAASSRVPAPAESLEWQPIETAPPDETTILRPHRIWGPMDVRRITNEQQLGTLSRGIDWQWLNGDLTTAWTESAFLPFWMPLPSVAALQRSRENRSLT